MLVTIGPPVAQALGEPVDRLSVERVFRAFSPDRRAVPRGACADLVAVLVAHAPLLGRVKRRRQPHRERQPLESIMGGDPSVETGAIQSHPYASFPASFSRSSLFTA